MTVKVIDHSTEIITPGTETSKNKSWELIKLNNRRWKKIVEYANLNPNLQEVIDQVTWEVK